MKKRLLACILTAALASCAAVSLSACGDDKNSSGADTSSQTSASSSGAVSGSGKSDNSAATSASGNEKDSKETQPAKSATNKNSNNTSNNNQESSGKTDTDSAPGGNNSSQTQKSGEAYVATAMECTVPYKGFLFITGEDNKANGSAPCRLPRLTIDSADAKKINDEIIEQYAAAFEFYNEMTDTNEMGRTDYVYYVNKNVLSLVVENRSVNTPNSYISVYNIDLNTGNRLDSSDIITLTGVSAEDVEAELRGVLSDLFDSIRDTGSPATKAYNRTMDAENIAKTDYFFDGNGALNASYRYFWIAGAENYGKLSILTPVIK